MNPKAIFGVILGEQCRTPDGIELYKNLVEVAHEKFSRSCVHNWSFLNILQTYLTSIVLPATKVLTFCLVM
jgi:hypothetical protein